MTSRPRSLRQLARNFELRDWVLTYANIRGFSDREAAIVGTSLVDRALEAALLRTFSALSKREVSDLFEGTAPLVSFSAKIKVGHAIGIIGTEPKADLEKIRTIRNTFAHSILEIDFETPEIQTICKAIKFPKVVKSMIPKIDDAWEIQTAKGIFLMAVTLYAALLYSEPSSVDPQLTASLGKSCE